jgi:hypothetical protein
MMLMRNARVGVVLALVVGLGALGCRKRGDAGPPVAVPTLTVSQARAALGSPVEVTYQFVVAPGAQFAGDYRVFVHFVDPDGELMWTDDHYPPVPTSTWRPGQTVKYSRTVFIPIYPYVGEATVKIGLYSEKDQRRLPLAAPDGGQLSYQVATLTLLPQTDNVFLIYRDGWHAAEVSPENVAVEWQWTKKEATLAFRNPKRDATFYLHLDGQPRGLAVPQVVTIRVGDQVVGTFTLASTDESVRRVPLPAAVLGNGDMVELKIGVAPTFVPAQLPGGQPGDSRELGVRVFHAFVAPQ